jgi:hypothetical protein
LIRKEGDKKMKVNVTLKNLKEFTTEIKENQFHEFAANALREHKSGFIVTKDAVFNLNDISHIIATE